MSDTTAATVRAELQRLDARLAACRHALERAEAAMCIARIYGRFRRSDQGMLDGAIQECRDALAGMAEGERTPNEERR